MANLPPPKGWWMMNTLKNVIKKNPKSERKQKKKKSSDLDEIYELLEEADLHITNRNKNMATANMQTDEVADSVSSDTESALCGSCITQVVDGVSCDFCERWFHYHEECSGVENAENKRLENEHILYVCDDCNKAKKVQNEMQKTNCNINNQKLNELKAQVSQMYDLMNNKDCTIKLKY